MEKAIEEYIKLEPTKIIDELSNKSDIKFFCNLDDTSFRAPRSPENIPKENERLSDVLFKVFGYPSKVYYKTIGQFIESYTYERDVVLDPMAGAGSTGLAALSTGRKAILNDGSILASFVSKNILLPVKSWKLKAAFLRLKERVKNRIEKLYLITCPHCGREQPTNTIFVSDVYSCPNCKQDFPLYGNKTSRKAVYSCPNCGYEINAYRTNDKEYRVEHRRPIKAKYDCENCACGKRIHTLEVRKNTIEKWNDFLRSKSHLFDELWIPKNRVITDRWYTRPGSWPGFKKGARFADLFTGRNLLALAIINDAIEKMEDGDIKSQLKFTFLSSLVRASNRMYTTSVVKTYYQVPAVGKVQNVWQVFERKFMTLMRSKKKLKKIVPFKKITELPKWVRVLNVDAKKLDLPDNSVDYIFLDPPRGSQIGYYELNSFYSCWLRNGSENLESEVIIPMETDDDERYAEKWSEMMSPILANAVRILKPNRFMTLMFHNLSNKIWNNLRNVLKKDLDLKYIGYVDPSRGTTFHTNRLSETSQKVSFITYQKKGKEVRSIHKIGEVTYKLPPQELEILKDEMKKRTKEQKPSFQEARDLAIKVVHENELSCIPSDTQLKNIISDL